MQEPDGRGGEPAAGPRRERRAPLYFVAALAERFLGGEIPGVPVRITRDGGPGERRVRRYLGAERAKDLHRCGQQRRRPDPYRVQLDAELRAPLRELGLPQLD